MFQMQFQRIFLAFLSKTHLACLHYQNKSGVFGGPAFFQPIKAFLKTFQIALIGWIKADPSKEPLMF